MQAYNIEAIERAALSGGSWLIQTMYPKRDLDIPSQDLQPYYKLPLALCIAGYRDTSAHYLALIRKTFYDQAGHFSEPMQKMPYLSNCYFYRDSWLLLATILLRRSSGKEIANRILDLQVQNGGFSCSPDEVGRQGLLATAVGGLIALSIGSHTHATRAADFIIDSFQMQPHPEKAFYLNRHSSGSLILDIPTENQNWFVFTPLQKRPLLYVFGLCTAFLAEAARLLRRIDLLHAAVAYYTYYKNICGVIGIQHPYSGKMGWAASLLYRYTGIEDYASTAIAIAKYLITRQRSDGSWLLEEFLVPGETSTFSLSMDRTAEFVVWLNVIYRNLKFSPHTLPPLQIYGNRDRLLL